MTLAPGLLGTQSPPTEFAWTASDVMLATRMTMSVPADKRAPQDRPADDDPSRSPANIAALALSVASTRSGRRVLGPMGYTVGLYENPTGQAGRAG